MYNVIVKRKLTPDFTKTSGNKQVTFRFFLNLSKVVLETTTFAKKVAYVQCNCQKKIDT